MMTSVADKYYRKISENIDKVKMKFDISSLLVKTKEHDSKINTNKNNIASNLTTLSNIDNDLVNSRGRLNTHQTDIQQINTNINAIKNNNLKISDEVFNDTYNIINQSFNFNEKKHSYKLFEKIIENNMSSGELIINTIINYKYVNLKNDINRLTHLYEFCDDKDKLFYSITLDNHDFSTSDFD